MRRGDLERDDDLGGSREVVMLLPRSGGGGNGPGSASVKEKKGVGSTILNSSDNHVGLGDRSRRQGSKWRAGR